MNDVVIELSYGFLWEQTRHIATQVQRELQMVDAVTAYMDFTEFLKVVCDSLQL